MPDAPATREEIEAAVEARIVKWLRTEGRIYKSLGEIDEDRRAGGAFIWLGEIIDAKADAIERGEHRETRDGE
jgi:hypothetical protein